VLAEPVLITKTAFRDERGFFLEAFNQSEFESQVGYSVRFVQDNHSRSSGGVLRGLHYQLVPSTQGKLVRVTSGAVFDVAVDLRRSSPRFGQWEGYELSEDNFLQLWVPPGFAHGFLVLSEQADVLYKTTDYYAPNLERSIRWDDPEISVDWPLEGLNLLISDKDRAAPNLSDADTFE